MRAAIIFFYRNALSGLLYRRLPGMGKTSGGLADITFARGTKE